ncbi:helix-turn-helix domain-containing protein [Klebsiella pneumoniae]|uniref:helix-turn-helix domain-containing protein n=1 Tax=Klebsiella pneumoniae TaxID=573 RepID=UPI001CBB1BF3|nr:XRE family transcriptional regulator [Klebsiella pneumoniae]MBZ1626595.1 XRE family transcriptional regulator [Klebsiella pneumoniae]HBY5479192.1 ImmA/IrrE family metallo-endopeptidase [Klebsiella pneumoniae]HBZ1331874.1 ImmA/IrrE family metallo-endopeptidase [Klebsiella pneumoniae]HCT4945707.1 XRE family transcriptional regulator [Klebsiella pneumoniae]
MFNSERLRIARERRGLTQRALAEATDLTSKTISNYEKAGLFEAIASDTMERISAVLGYPIEFFRDRDVPTLSPEAVSFRAMTKLTAQKRDSALGAGKLAQELSAWIDEQFKLPKPNVPDCSFDGYSEPERAARAVRECWGVGELSISNLIHLLEANGVRVFSLAENCVEVDAFSFWMDNKPFVLLNTMKTPERSRFDAAHELGHLVLHKHSTNNGRQAEQDADRFASAFLMPERSVLASVPRMPSLDLLISLKKNWKVSLAALVRRTFDVGLSTEWHYRQLSIELARRGYRTGEPQGMEEREKSLVLDKVFSALRTKGVKRGEILEQLKFPADEASALTFNNSFFMEAINGGKLTALESERCSSHLRLVK